VLGVLGVLLSRSRTWSSGGSHTTDVAPIATLGPRIISGGFRSRRGYVDAVVQRRGDTATPTLINLGCFGC
jgi:hypothetical protein